MSAAARHFDMEGKMKYDAWARRRAKPRSGVQEYVDLVEN
jgi:acyl-CoA-binding protein